VQPLKALVALLADEYVDATLVLGYCEHIAQGDAQQEA
jgi:hypothetical protein